MLARPARHACWIGLLGSPPRNAEAGQGMARKQSEPNSCAVRMPTGTDVPDHESESLAAHQVPKAAGCAVLFAVRTSNDQGISALNRDGRLRGPQWSSRPCDIVPQILTLSVCNSHASLSPTCDTAVLPSAGRRGVRQRRRARRKRCSEYQTPRATCTLQNDIITQKNIMFPTNATPLVYEV